MKRRVRKIANFFAFNLLFFALYLNFIHKDNVPVATAADQASVQNKPAFSGTVIVETPENMDKKAEATAVSAQQSAGKELETATTKLSIN